MKSLTTGTSAAAIACMMMAGTAAAQGGGFVFEPGEPEPTQEERRQSCEEAWNESELADYCSGATFNGWEGIPQRGEMCGYRNASCSVTVPVTVGDETADVTYTETKKRAARLVKLPSMLICLKPNNANEKYVMRMRLECKSTETWVGTAETEGLTAPWGTVEETAEETLDESEQE